MFKTYPIIMKNKIAKSHIKQVCIQKQEELIDSFKQHEAEMYKDTFSQNAIASQTEDRKAGKVDVLKALGKELVFAQEELVYLNSINVTGESSVVEPGAVVITDQITFFIGVSSEKIEVDGEEIIGISTKAPIYAKMIGLKKGSPFQFNETKYLIEDLY